MRGRGEQISVETTTENTPVKFLRRFQPCSGFYSPFKFPQFPPQLSHSVIRNRSRKEEEQIPTIFAAVESVDWSSFGGD